MFVATPGFRIEGGQIFLCALYSLKIAHISSRLFWGDPGASIKKGGAELGLTTKLVENAENDMAWYRLYFKDKGLFFLFRHCEFAPTGTDVTLFCRT